MTTLTEAKQDRFLQFAANDLIGKGLTEEQAWTMVMNTYCPEDF
jgi:hypothetical protein